MEIKLRVAICNRGEVAVRIIRTCQDMGFTTILIHSTPDKDSLAFEMADETIELSGDSPLQTYLNIPAVIEALKKCNADLVHPGFGFLSENAVFAKAVEDLKIKFIGPSSETIAVAGNKILAKEMAQKAGVPVSPAFVGDFSDSKTLLAEVKKLGYPCIVKAASGGGGKGMKIVRHDKELFESVASSQRESLNAFGSEKVFIEKYFESPRHIEVQILCDAHGQKFHFYERECSVQRRHQKIFEETPSPALDPVLREKICGAALKLARAVNYTNAGTVEFLLTADGSFYFMELNTRLQVEHTVTEEVCGVDLVKLQIAIALGEKLGFSQTDIGQRGHALEVRVYSENPAQEFLPSTGKILVMDLPKGPGRRFDFGYSSGNEVTTHYDPMIGKIITWAPSREENIMKMLATLKETVIFGIHTNIEFLKAVLSNAGFKSGTFDTSFLSTEFPSGFKPRPLTPDQVLFAENAKSSVQHTRTALKYQSPWVSS